MNSKTTVASATLIAAVPAAILGFFLVASFLTGLGKLGTSFMVLYAVTLLVCAGVVFLPFAVMIFAPKSIPAPKERAEEEESDAKKSEEKVGEGFGDGFAVQDAEENAPPVSTGELEIVDTSLSQGDLEVVDSESGEIDALADDDFTFDDEELPKKKKGK